MDHCWIYGAKAHGFYLLNLKWFFTPDCDDRQSEDIFGLNGRSLLCA